MKLKRKVKGKQSSIPLWFYALIPLMFFSYKFENTIISYPNGFFIFLLALYTIPILITRIIKWKKDNVLTIPSFILEIILVPIVVSFMLTKSTLLPFNYYLVTNPINQQVKEFRFKYVPRRSISTRSVKFTFENKTKIYYGSYKMDFYGKKDKRFINNPRRKLILYYKEGLFGTYIIEGFHFENENNL